MKNGLTVAAVLISLLAFGFTYDALVGWLERKGYARGYTALLVVFGTAVTLIGFGLLIGSWPMALLATACFAASGAPMVLGSWWRHVIQRAKDERSALRIVREELVNDQKKSRRVFIQAGTGEGDKRQPGSPLSSAADRG